MDKDLGAETCSKATPQARSGLGPLGYDQGEGFRITIMPSEALFERIGRAMLADELSPGRNVDDEWESERLIWVQNARAAINALRLEGGRS